MCEDDLKSGHMFCSGSWKFFRRPFFDFPKKFSSFSLGGSSVDSLLKDTCSKNDFFFFKRAFFATISHFMGNWSRNPLTESVLTELSATLRWRWLRLGLLLLFILDTDWNKTANTVLKFSREERTQCADGNPVAPDAALYKRSPFG